jgi:hypothetical protein
LSDCSFKLSFTFGLDLSSHHQALGTLSAVGIAFDLNDLSDMIDSCLILSSSQKALNESIAVGISIVSSLM